MRRRDLLKAAAAGVAASAAPRIGRSERPSKLVFAPVSDLAVLDPVVTFNRPTRNYAYLVFDTLYGLDTSWMAQPQMVEGHEIEKDGLTWNLKLRDGLRFHDNEPVLARDVVASIRRFAQRISLAGALMTATDELSAPDDSTVRFRLKRPFPHLPDAVAGPGGTVPAIMPERLAVTSPFKPVAEIVGSGPYRFLPEEHVSGARSGFARFARYQPRPDGVVGFTSGPKIAHFDRVEWLTLDTFSAMAALQKGEIDWWETPPRDLIGEIARDRNITAVSQYATAIGILRFNHLHPPFDNPAVRRALLGAVDQAEAMTAVAGEDRAAWSDGVGLFSTGTPLANDAGVEIMRTPRDYASVRQQLEHAGYKGETVVIISPTDLPGMRNLSLVGADQLRRAGIKVDLQEMDAGTVVRRRTNQAPPDKAAGMCSLRFSTDQYRTPTPMVTRRSAPMASPDGMAGRRAPGSKPCAQPGWTPPVSMSSGGSAPSFRCSCGRTSRIFRWASIGRQLRTGRI